MPGALLSIAGLDNIEASVSVPTSSGHPTWAVLNWFDSRQQRRIVSPYEYERASLGTLTFHAPHGTAGLRAAQYIA